MVNTFCAQGVGDEMNNDYFQTWTYVSKLKRIGFKRTVKIIQFFCGVRGHELSKTEWGYGGGDYADRWCRWCNKLIQVPKEEVKFEFRESSRLMKEIERNIKN